MLNPPYKSACPDCGHEFTLPELKEMAVGDNWQRFFWARTHDGSERVVSFDEYNPATMTALEKPSTIPGLTPPSANTLPTGG